MDIELRVLGDGLVVKGDGERGLEDYSLVSGLSKQLGSRAGGVSWEVKV